MLFPLKSDMLPQGSAPAAPPDGPILWGYCISHQDAEQKVEKCWCLTSCGALFGVFRVQTGRPLGKKLASLTGQVAYARRKWIAEAPHGWLKEGLGFRRISLRGLQSVQGEWDLVCLALNIKRISALMAA